MYNFLRALGNFLKSPLGIAIVGPLLAAIIGVPSLWFSYKSNIYVQDRQRVIEDIRGLDEANTKLLEVGALFIGAINTSSNLAAAREKISVLLAQQSVTAASLKTKIRPADHIYVKDYENALRDLNVVSKQVSSAAEMRSWAEAFGRVLDAKSRLAQVINLGVS